MKTAMIARFVLGAASIFAVGCGAETGSEGVEQSHAALSNAAPSAVTAGITAITNARFLPGSCVISEDGQDKLVVAGGFDNTGTPSDDIYVYDPIGNSWTLLETAPNTTKHLKTPRGNLQAIRTATNKCVFVGGANKEPGVASPTVYKDVDELVSNGSGSWTVNNLTDLNKARVGFALSTCKTSGNVSKLVVVGGFNSATGTYLNSVEVSDDLDPAAWTDTATLTTARYDFGFAKDPNGERYIVAGGHTSGAAQYDTIETITTNSTTCAPTATEFTAAGKFLPTAVEGPVAFFEGTTDQFIVAGGKATGTLVATAKAYRVDVTWATPTVSVSDANANDLPAAVYMPTVLQSFAGTHIANMVLGGTNADTSPSTDLNTVATNGLQQYQDAYNWHSANLVGGHFGGVAGLIDGTVYLVSGKSIASGTATYSTAMEAITP